MTRFDRSGLTLLYCALKYTKGYLFFVLLGGKNEDYPVPGISRDQKAYCCATITLVMPFSPFPLQDFLKYSKKASLDTSELEVLNTPGPWAPLSIPARPQPVPGGVGAAGDSGSTQPRMCPLHTSGRERGGTDQGAASEG